VASTRCFFSSRAVRRADCAVRCVVLPTKEPKEARPIWLPRGALSFACLCERYHSVLHRLHVRLTSVPACCARRFLTASYAASEAPPNISLLRPTISSFSVPAVRHPSPGRGSSHPPAVVFATRESLKLVRNGSIAGVSGHSACQTEMQLSPRPLPVSRPLKNHSLCVSPAQTRRSPTRPVGSRVESRANRRLSPAMVGRIGQLIPGVGQVRDVRFLALYAEAGGMLSAGPPRMRLSARPNLRATQKNAMPQRFGEPQYPDPSVDSTFVALIAT
jgi:hypothetical protein